jgi:hypothetical protein
MRTLGKFLLALSIFWLWISMSRLYYICQLKAFCAFESSDADLLSKIPKTLTLRADGILVLEKYPEFVFDKNADTLKLFKEHDEFLSLVSTMLKSQPAARLLVKAYHNADEDAAVAGKRASFIIDKLTKKYSIPQIMVLQLTDLSADNRSGQLGFEMLGYLPSADLLVAREDSLFKLQWKDSLTNVSYNGVLGIFEPKLNEMKASNQFIVYCDSLISFLKTRPGATVQIFGHCDTHTADSEADKTALHFANLSSNYLKKAGIKNKITAMSKGKKEPLQKDRLPDDSADVLAIAKNRRINILIKEPIALKPKNKKR